MVRKQIGSLPSSTQRVIALSHYFYLRNSGKSKTKSKEDAAAVVDCTPRTLHTWIDECEESDGEIKESLPGQHPKFTSILVDEDIQKRAREWVMQHACVRGQPNMRALDFQQWINSELLPSKFPENSPSISEETARLWLHRLGFKRLSHRAGVYKDGHEKPENVYDRHVFVSRMTELDERQFSPLPAIPSLDPADLPTPEFKYLSVDSPPTLRPTDPKASLLPLDKIPADGILSNSRHLYYVYCD